MRTGIWQTVEYRQKQSKRMKGVLSNLEVRKRISENTKIGCAKRKELGLKRKSSPMSEECKQKISNSLKGYREFRFHKGEKRGTKSGYKCSPEHIEKIRQNSLRQWQNPETRDRLVNSLLNMRSPNNQELEVLDILNTNFNNEWKYVGNGNLIFGGLCPDYVNINGRKLIIEFFGRYWHKQQDERFRQKVFAQYGYKTLIIWSEELADKNTLLSKIDNWLRVN